MEQTTITCKNCPFGQVLEDGAHYKCLAWESEGRRGEDDCREKKIFVAVYEYFKYIHFNGAYLYDLQQWVIVKANVAREGANYGIETLVLTKVLVQRGLYFWNSKFEVH